MELCHSHVLIDSLRTAPLLVGDLDEAPALDRSLLGIRNVDTYLRADQKLGHLYEDALRVLLERAERLELLADHVQVFDANQITLGEIDYVLRDVCTQQLIHLELSVKFYLGVRTAEGWRFPGPDPRDNWQRKLARLRSHQLQLSQCPEAQDLFRERWGSADVQVRQLIYGCLFYPLGESECLMPEGVQPDCRKGHWLYEAEWDEHFAEVIEVTVIPKPLWPVEITQSLRAALPRLSVADLRAASAERCTMFALPNCAEPHFLMPNGWLR